MRRLLLRVLVVVVAVVPVACGRDTPTAPPPAVVAPTVPPGRQPISVVDGIDGRGLAFAAVTIDNEFYSTDASGRIDFPASLYTSADTGAAVAVALPGYLSRRTVVPPSRRITLWPVAIDEESEEALAVQAMVYGSAVGRHQPRTRTSIQLIFTASQEVRDAWMEEASSFGAPLGLSYEFGAYDPHDPYGNTGENQLQIRFEQEPAGCTSEESAGYCRTDSEGRAFSVAIHLARDVRTIRRVLAAWFLHPNPLPGLLNDDQPTDELSPLEARTIRMILQRPRPSRWPDDDL